MGYDYIFPSETGNRSDCSWVMFRGKDTREKVRGAGSKIRNNTDGFMIVSQHRNDHQKFHFSALLHSQLELHRATHTHQLEQRNEGDHIIYCNFDSHLMGIGGDVGWAPCVYDEYLLNPDREYSSE